MAKIAWDVTGQRFYETGNKKGVLYPMKDGAYGTGVAWNGLINVNHSPSGAESTPLYADDIKYLNLVSVEEFSYSIEAYTYPDEFAVCDGSAELVEGVTIGQQTRQAFGFSHVTTLGNDSKGTDYGYKIHLIYNSLAAPSEKGFASINNDPEAITFSWECSTTPVEVAGFKPTSILTINSTKVDPTKLAALEKVLYGDENTEPRLPLPNEVLEILSA